uniref:NADH-ubiquinone oxidoreductase chain 2 n=1 Tax=Ranina ranina TaxID=156228 RepID=W6JIE2_RANRA|nr:NADH dehydrogenase subunit 2 [Ranina ranina]BAO48232.1 NADH dehydrogenase subunit 2 [Ranina ranina]
MIFPPHSLPFLILLLLGVLMAISSPSWFSAWVGLELNLMSFIPLIAMKGNYALSEASLKYFLIQALGSSIIIFSSCLLLMVPSFALILLLSSLLLKLGSAPFHFWFPQVTEGLNWIQASLLLTIQKIAPMFLISYLLLDPLVVFLASLAAIMSAITGALGGINQTYLRKLMAFSSINHMSWMIFSLILSELSWFIYFSFYSLISFSVISLFHLTQVYHLSNLFNFRAPLPLPMLVFSLSLLSLGGLPPFSGFIPKWMVVQMMVTGHQIIPLFVLLMSALFTLYFYVRMFNMFVIKPSPTFSWYLLFKTSNYNFEIFSFVILMNLIGLPFSAMFFML